MKHIKDVIVRLDRQVFTSEAALKSAFGALAEFHTESDIALKNSALHWGAYGRLRILNNTQTKTRLFVYYRPRFRPLPSIRVAVVPDDLTGLRRQELDAVWRAFQPCRLRNIEIALDFAKGGGMDAKFVRRHLKCGKSRLRHTPKYPKAAWVGAAGSAKFIRSYWKSPVDGYRIELQLNPGSLQKQNIKTPADFVRLVEVANSQIKFVEIDWASLSRSVRRHYPRHGRFLLRKARRQSGVLRELLKFLRSIGITNPTRFLVPMAINGTVFHALRSWARRWEKDANV